MIPDISDAPQTPDARADHKRMLARARQARKRARSRGHDVTEAVTRAVTRDLRPREVRVIQGILDGKTQSQALVEAGFHKASRTVLETIREPLRAALHAHGLTIDKVSEGVKMALDATSPMLTADGCIERADWPARAAGRRDAIALLDRAGELPSSQAETTGPAITVQVVRYGDVIHQHQALDVVDGEPQQDAIDVDAV